MCYVNGVQGPADEPSPLTLNCPHCNGALEAACADQPQLVTCPYCNQDIVLPAFGASAQMPGPSLDSQPFVIDESPQPPENDDELDALRIRRISLLRRSAYRSRSYCLIGAALCAVAAVQLICNTVQHVRRVGWGLKPLAYLVAIPLGFLLALRLYRRSVQLKREADQSSLSDGTHQWKNLEDLR
jgi:hypothetical protein